MKVGSSKTHLPTGHQAALERAKTRSQTFLDNAVVAVGRRRQGPAVRHCHGVHADGYRQDLKRQPQVEPHVRPKVLCGARLSDAQADQSAAGQKHCAGGAQEDRLAASHSQRLAIAQCQHTITACDTR